MAASAIGGLIGAPFQLGVRGPGGWWVLPEPEPSLGVDPGFDPVVPDLAGWRLARHPDRPAAAQRHVVPDWVREIQSPGTARQDRLLELPFYARACIGHA